MESAAKADIGTDLAFSKQELIKQCRALETELSECREKIAKTAAVTAKSESSVTSPIDKLRKMREEECVLRETLVCVQEAEPTALSADQTVVRHHVLCDLRSTVAGLRDSIKTVDKEIEDLEQALTHRRTTSKHLSEIATSLRDRNEPSKARKLADKTAADKELALKQMKKRYRSVESTLADFLDEYFPATDNKTKSPKKKTWHGGDWERHFDHESRPWNTHSLAEIIESLLHATSGDPYINITKCHWPPYRELLIRIGIAERHPDDPYRFRLVPVHEGL